MATTERRRLGLRTGTLTGLHWIGIAAAAVTAAIHLLLGVKLFPGALGISFLLAGLGFLGAIALVLLDYRRQTIYRIGIPYTLAQIALWYYINFAAGPKSFPADVGTLGAVDKVVQVVLIVVLVLLIR